MINKIKSLIGHQGFMRYFRNTSWLFAERILRIAVGLFVGIWVARYLGPVQFGLLSYAQSFVGLFSAVATLGLDAIVIRELVKDDSRRDELMATAFWLKFFGAVSIIVTLALAVNFTSNDTYTNSIVFVIASASVFQAFNVVDFYFQSVVLSRYVVFANFISLFTSSIAKIMLIIYEAPLIAFAWMVFFDNLILALGLIYFYLKHSSSKVHEFKFKRETAIFLLKDSWPLFLSGLLISVYMKIDQVMIKEMLDNEAVGQYAVAVRLSEAWYFIPVVVSSSLFPAIINAKNQSEKLYYTRLKKLYDLMVWISVVIALSVTFVSDNLVNLLYGDQYNQSGSVLMIHVWAGVFAALGVVTGKVVVINNRQKNGMYSTLAGAFFNIILNYLMIPSYGIQGAAFATMISQIFSGFVIPIWFELDKNYPKIALKSLIFLGVKE